MNATARTQSLCPCKVARSRPEATSHSLTLASELPEPAAHEILALEAHIYGAAPGRWDGRALAAAFAQLAATQGRAATAVKEEPLMPLYR